MTARAPSFLAVPTVTIRLPDGKHERLKALVRASSISISKLMDELAAAALANYDARAHFEDGLVAPRQLQARYAG